MARLIDLFTDDGTTPQVRPFYVPVWAPCPDCATCDGTGAHPFDGAQCGCCVPYDALGFPMVEGAETEEE